MSARRAGAPRAAADLGADDLAPVPLLRVAPELVDTVAQLLWVAAPDTQILHDDPDDAGLLPLFTRAPLSAAAAASFERGLDALLAESSERRAGTYLREVRDLRGRRRELARPVPASAWRERACLVGPFADEAGAAAWAATLPPGWFGDALPHAEAWYVDVFPSEDEVVRAAAR